MLSTCSQLSPCLMPGSSIWLGSIQRSRQIATIIPPIHDNLPAQCKIIKLYCYILGNGFKVHVPRLSAPGSLSHIQLKMFKKLPHTVYAFSLGQIRGMWLFLEEEIGCYYFQLSHVVHPKG
jgi:hypothetical protein